MENKKFKTGESFEKYMIKNNDWPRKAVLIDTNQGTAIAICIGEALSQTWKSGDVMLIWPTGEHTCADGLKNITIINEDIFTASFN